ncbi:MAG: hypothetical protein RSC93_10475 [Erysipelotrichaceae bacterium]
MNLAPVRSKLTDFFPLDTSCLKIGMKATQCILTKGMLVFGNEINTEGKGYWFYIPLEQIDKLTFISQENYAILTIVIGKEMFEFPIYDEELKLRDFCKNFKQRKKDILPVLQGNIILFKDICVLSLKQEPIKEETPPSVDETSLDSTIINDVKESKETKDDEVKQEEVPTKKQKFHFFRKK